MSTIRQLLRSKGDQIWSIGPRDSVYDAIALMAEKGVGALLVRDGERVVGIVSERDYARRVILRGRRSSDTLVEAIMTAEVVDIDADRSVADGLALMTDRRIRHLPVRDAGGELLGVVSIGDLVKAVIEEQRMLIEQLEQYIKSG
ncbi:MAG: CBS domain-containing protein [Ectothiorhodospiraceae bacterium]|nr:CBS domain-containing protein [Chromatiales bacterium]MCP5155652.1 CBS domain-containing protein [Ectothiorhodospiraceae bacterium]